jgi:hypothetical protein
VSGEDNLKAIQAVYEAFGRGDVGFIPDSVTQEVCWATDTSSRAAPCVIPVDPRQAQIDLRTNAGKAVRLAVVDLDRLDYGFASAVRRSQGVPLDRAHMFADGDGRELTYVAMSRARDRSEVYVVASDTATTVHDLRRDRQNEKCPRWGDRLRPPGHRGANPRDEQPPGRRLSNGATVRQHRRFGERH